MADVRGLRVLVTGVTGGIGTPLAERLAREGETVLAHGRDLALEQALSGVTGRYFDVKRESRALLSAYDDATRKKLRELTEALLAACARRVA